jgi:hypothetical protein
MFVQFLPPEAERCYWCDDLTGKAGAVEDSIYLQDKNGIEIGPFCTDCAEELGPEPIEWPPNDF